MGEGRIIALNGEAGYQVEVLRGGIHFGLWRWKYRIHRVGLVTVPQGQLAYVYARDGEPLPPSQTLGRVVPCNNFQDARAFLIGTPLPESAPAGESAYIPVGQRGRQRAILRERRVRRQPRPLRGHHGDERLPVGDTNQAGAGVDPELAERAPRDRRLPSRGDRRLVEASDPLRPESTTQVDSIGIVTVHDGPSLQPARSSPPDCGNTAGDPHYHNNYQDPEAFLRSGGRRGRQYTPLTDGTYFVNRWFATVEVKRKRSFRSATSAWWSATTARPAATCPDHVSVTANASPRASAASGNGRSAGQVPVQLLRRQPGARPDNELRPPLGDREDRGPPVRRVAGRLTWSRTTRTSRSCRSAWSCTSTTRRPRGDPAVRRRQEADHADARPMLSAYFRDVAHKKTMLQLLQERDLIQQESGRSCGGNSVSSTSSASTCSSASRRPPRPTARSRPCSSNCACGSCRWSRSRPTNDSGPRPRSSSRSTRRKR